MCVCVHACRWGWSACACLWVCSGGCGGEILKINHCAENGIFWLLRSNLSCANKLAENVIVPVRASYHEVIETCRNMVDTPKNPANTFVLQLCQEKMQKRMNMIIMISEAMQRKARVWHSHWKTSSH